MANHPIPINQEMAGACVDQNGGAVGLPQLCVDWLPNQIFWAIVALVLIFVLLKFFAMPRIGSVLAERKGLITNDLAAAEELKQKARDAEAAYLKALADARAESARFVAQAKAEIKAQLDTATAKAETEIAARSAESERRIGEIRASALSNVTEVAKDTAKELVLALGGASDATSVDAAVTARLKG